MKKKNDLKGNNKKVNYIKGIQNLKTKNTPHSIVDAFSLVSLIETVSNKENILLVMLLIKCFQIDCNIFGMYHLLGLLYFLAIIIS